MTLIAINAKMAAIKLLDAGFDEAQIVSLLSDRENQVAKGYYDPARIDRIIRESDIKTVLNGIV